MPLHSITVLLLYILHTFSHGENSRLFRFMQFFYLHNFFGVRIVNGHLLTYCVPHIVFQFLISLLIKVRAAICIKSCLPAFSIGKQCETHCMFQHILKSCDRETTATFIMFSLRSKSCFDFICFNVN